MRVLKVLGASALALVAIAVLLLKFSAVETRYRCTGSLATQGQTDNVEVFLKRQSYRWWVGLWSQSQGSFWLEIPNRTVEYYSNVTGTDILGLSGSDGFRGTFSTLSNALQVNVPTVGNFTGVCQRISADA
jgi:hypothetical protein